MLASQGGHGGNAIDGIGTGRWRKNRGIDATGGGGQAGGHKTYRVDKNLGESTSHRLVGRFESTGGSENPGVELTPQVDKHSRVVAEVNGVPV